MTADEIKRVIEVFNRRCVLNSAIGANTDVDFIALQVLQAELERIENKPLTIEQL